MSREDTVIITRSCGTQIETPRRLVDFKKLEYSGSVNKFGVPIYRLQRFHKPELKLVVNN